MGARRPRRRDPGRTIETLRHSDGSFFGRRKGKTLRRTQRETLDRALPRLLLDLADPPPGRLAELFPSAVEEVQLEIGFGGGEHLLDQAVRFPAVGFIGVEPFQNGMAKAVSAIAQQGITNVRLWNEDARFLLDWLPPGTVARIDLLYPDPWPKPRHWRRRFIQEDNVSRIARCLQSGGAFRFASDVEAYVKWTLREIGKSADLEWVEGSLDRCRAPWQGWLGTRYEAKAIREGRRPAYLTFCKRGPSPPITSAAGAL